MPRENPLDSARFDVGLETPSDRLFPRGGRPGNPRNPARADIFLAPAHQSEALRVFAPDALPQRPPAICRGAVRFLDRTVFVGCGNELAGELTAEHPGRLGENHREASRRRGFGGGDPAESAADDQHVAGKGRVGNFRVGGHDAALLDIEDAAVFKG